MEAKNVDVTNMDSSRASYVQYAYAYSRDNCPQAKFMLEKDSSSDQVKRRTWEEEKN